MLRRLTTPILVIGILHLVGGGLGLIGSLCGGAGLLIMPSISSLMPPTPPARPGLPPPPAQPPDYNEAMNYMNDRVPGYRAFTIGTLAVNFLTAGMLVSAGIGLLKMQPWARWLSLVYAFISILVHIGSFVYTLVWVIPATQALYANFTTMAPGFSSLMTISSEIGAFGTLLFIIYPITVLIILLLPSTSAAFRGEIPARENDLRDSEESDEDEWREPPRSDKFRQ